MLTSRRDMKRKREYRPIDDFYRYCTNKQIEDARIWWAVHGDTYWNETSSLGKRPVAHCVVRLGDPELLRIVYEAAHDVFLDASKEDASTVFHEAVIHDSPLEVFRFLCENLHWQDLSEDGDRLGRPAIVAAIQRWPKGDPRLLLLIDYYGKHVPSAFTQNPVKIYYQTPWECANDIMDKDSECFRRMESYIVQSPLSPVQTDPETDSEPSSSYSSSSSSSSNTDEKK
jgi:hypothetical protein